MSLQQVVAAAVVPLTISVVVNCKVDGLDVLLLELVVTLVSFLIIMMNKRFFVLDAVSSEVEELVESKYVVSSVGSSADVLAVPVSSREDVVLVGYVVFASLVTGAVVVTGVVAARVVNSAVEDAFALIIVSA